MNLIAIINQTTLATPDEVAAYADAQQIQISRDVEPHYRDAKVLLVGPNDKVPRDAWPMLLIDTDADVPDAIAWHEVDGLHPTAIVPLKLSLDAGDPWTLAASHEALEMLVDPYCVRYTMARYKGRRAAVIEEICDPVENDSYQINDVVVSNFVLPRWFSVGKHQPGDPFDFLGKLLGPFPLMSLGGYFQYSYDLVHWNDVFGKEAKSYRKDKWKYSRRAKRERLR